ncbi:MAG: ankyrin repeat domain-containing protein [Alphaproteobacteria bacterium]
MATNTFNQNSSKTKRLSDAGMDEYIRHFKVCLEAGDVKKVKEYCDTYADALTFNGFDDDKGTALHVAAEAGKLDVIEYLLAQGADINALDRAGDKPAHTASNMLKEMAALRLVEAGTQPDNTLLEYAACHGQPTLAKRCLDAGTSPNFIRKNGLSVLMTAAYGCSSKGPPEVVTLLIDRGADVLFKNAEGETALTYALGSKRIDAAILLEREMRKAQEKLDASTVLQKNMTVGKPLALK